MYSKQLIGITDRLDFPDLQLQNVKAKIDTGAYTSALHSKDIELHMTPEPVLSFRIVEEDGHISRQYMIKRFGQRLIRNSFGVAEWRYVIKTRIVLFGRVIRAEFTLSDREQLRYPVLLGRRLLRNRFVVDVSKRNLSYQQKKHASSAS